MRSRAEGCCAGTRRAGISPLRADCTASATRPLHRGKGGQQGLIPWAPESNRSAGLGAAARAATTAGGSCGGGPASGLSLQEHGVSQIPGLGGTQQLGHPSSSRAVESLRSVRLQGGVRAGPLQRLHSAWECGDRRAGRFVQAPRMRCCGATLPPRWQSSQALDHLADPAPACILAAVFARVRCEPGAQGARKAPAMRRV